MYLQTEIINTEDRQTRLLFSFIIFKNTKRFVARSFRPKLVEELTYVTDPFQTPCILKTP